MITALTTSQVAMLDEVRDEWLAIGLSTDPADRSAAENGVRLAYARAGLAAPEIMVWLDSPLAGCVGSAMLGDQVWGQVGDQVRDQVRGQVGGQVGWSLWGQHDAGWLAWADAMTRIGVACDTAGLQQVARSAGWWWAFGRAAILTDRPDLLARDQQGRLHSGVGPALRYRDGWGIHAWHGTRVPADLIEVGWDARRTLTEPNAEIRRCAVEITAGRDGWDQIIREAGWAQVGHDEPDPGNPGQTLRLYHVPRNGARSGGIGLYDEPVRILHCTNATRERDGSRHEFGLTVPADITDPVAAAAWSFDLDPTTYRALQRAC